MEDKLYDNVADRWQHHDLAGDPATADLRSDRARRLVAEIERVEDRAPRIVRRRRA